LQTWLRVIRRKISPRKVYQPAGEALDFGMKAIIASKNYRLSSRPLEDAEFEHFAPQKTPAPGARGPSGG